jgi:NADH dehydrogenase
VSVSISDPNPAKPSPLATLFGGAGFLGRHVGRALLERGWRLRIASRSPDQTLFADLPDSASRVDYVQADISDYPSIAASLRDTDAVVNLTGILTQSGQQTFDGVHHRGAALLANAARKAGITKFVHVSAIGADENSASAYARSKAAGEQAVLSALPSAIIARPSLIFGPEDDFFNRFAAMARLSPALPLIGGGKTLFQPVYVGDVALMIVKALSDEAKAGTIYEMGGPETYSFADLLSYICAVTGKKRLLVPIPFGIAPIIAAGIELTSLVAMGHFPRMLLITRDQVASLRTDNVVSDSAHAEGRTLQALGIKPQSIDTIVPTYI